MSEIAKWLNTRFQLTLIPKENSNTEFVGPCIFREDGDNTKVYLGLQSPYSIPILECKHAYCQNKYRNLEIFTILNHHRMAVEEQEDSSPENLTLSEYY